MLSRRNPLLAFWTSPRETIAAVVHTDPDLNVVGLAWLAGTGEMLANALLSESKDPGGPLLRVILAIVMGPPAGFARVYLAGLFLAWTGRWLGGSARAPECRTAVAWSLLPLIVGGVLTVPLLLLQTHPAPWEDPFTLAAAFLLFIGYAWCGVLLVKTVSEVHRFSSWRSFSALALSGFLAGVSTLAILVGVAFLIGFRP